VEYVNRDYIIPSEIPYTAQYKALWDYPLYSGRNYDRFAVLADVRNHHGCNPIDHPRGVPDDASYNVRKENERWGMDGHSHSWFSLQELDAFNWDAVAWREERFVGTRRFSADKDQYAPERHVFAHAIARHGVRVGAARIGLLNILLDAEIVNPLVAKAELTHHHTQRVPVTYKEALNWHDDCLPALRKLAPKGDASKIRVVFWFDN
jgi:hypothetical protein